MLKDAQAILLMLKEQERALTDERIGYAARANAMIDAIKQDKEEFELQLDAMLGNVRLAIRKIEGTTEEVTHG